MVASMPIVATILKTLNTVSSLGWENQKLQGEIEGSLGLLKREVEMAEWDVGKYEGVSVSDNLTVLKMQELLCEIDDFTSDLSIPGKAAAFFNSLLARDSRPREIKIIESFLASIKSIGDRQKEYSSKQGNDASTNLPSAATASASASASPPPPYYAPEKDLDEGFPETKKEFEELLSPAHGRQLRLISIVGCSGLGKTALARAVYETTAVQCLPATTTEIHGPNETTTHVPLCLPTPEIHEVDAANEATSFYQSPSTTEIHQSPSTTTEIHEPITASETTHAPPFPRIAEIHETSAFNCKAWVEASTCKDTEDLLNKILNILDPTAAGGNNTKIALNDFLLDKRYLIIIDDLRSCGVKWMNMEHAFPENGKDSRIIVTTSVHSIARDYSSGWYYVYPLQCLDEINSKGLFRKNVFARCRSRTDFTEPEKEHLENILARCGGLPLALISSGNYLCWEERNPFLSDDRYKEVCEELRNIVARDETAFGDMKRVFSQYYKDLTDYDHKICLLYLSIFPRGHQININSFIRRLKGEVLVAGDVHKCLKYLIEKSMIQPSLARSSCSVAKRCQVQGMMLEFAIHKSVSRNLVTLVDDGGNVLRNEYEKTVRRLTIQSSSRTAQGRDLIPEEIEPSSVRSLTIFGGKLLSVTPEDAVRLRSSKMMRVLDLEGCKGLNGSSTVVNDICEMLLLNYLSLKNTDVDELPTKMKNLKRLETLDIRQTQVAILPVEIIMLPELANLFGEFELPRVHDREIKNVTKFLKEKSKLHTLSGIVVNKAESFKAVIEHARKLKKVKICGDNYGAAPAAPTPSRTFRLRAFFGFFGESGGNLVAPNGSASDLPVSRTNLVSSSRRCAEALVSSLQKRATSLDSVSIHASGISKAFLASDMKACVVSSIKLRGPLKNLSASTLKNLRCLKKLHIFSTGLSSQTLVDALQFLNCLQYLKLVEDHHTRSWEGDFSVHKDGFPVLRELCFKGGKKYPRLKITEGAMTLLTSLQLICPNLAPAEEIKGIEYHYPLIRVEGMEHLKNLDEVILHHTADVPTVKAWENAARMHTNMPCVKKQPKPAQSAI